ncbi:hypothetical protein HKX48_007148 [Thoreauomyces humboldtii]|nr:hypothetical protein HKX48_007148 [Thoreauomyces humboldtii]
MGNTSSKRKALSKTRSAASTTSLAAKPALPSVVEPVLPALPIPTTDEASVSAESETAVVSIAPVVPALEDMTEVHEKQNDEAKDEHATPFKIICLTGGPCGGKTSSLAILGDLFQSLGWKVYRVPETATILLSAGVVFSELNDEQSYSFQKNLLQTMMAIQNTYIDLARLTAARGQKTIVICDRGAMDPSAYMPREGWLRMLQELNLDEAAIRDNRYDCVIHLVTAAKGAETFYTQENNKVRSEGIDFARHIDTLTMNAWLGHASLQVIDNSSVSNFAQKCDRTVQAVLTRLGLVTDAERYGKHVRKHKFVIKNFTLSDDFPVQYRDFHVEHVYLVNTAGDGVQIRIRRRQEVGAKEVHVSMTVRHPEVDGQRVETRRNLRTREYEALRAQADPSRAIITKKRRCFLYNDRYFQLDVYEHPCQGLTLMETYLDFDFHSPTSPVSSEAIETRVPEWLEAEEVTDNKKYSMFTLAESAPLDQELARKLSRFDLNTEAA